MITEFTDCCGWVRYPSSQDGHSCSTDTDVNPDPNTVFLMMNADLTDDSDY